MNSTATAIYSIGHSNHSIERFLELLRQHRVQVVADTRSSPYSKYAAQFNDRELTAELRSVGIEYLFFGRQLGGRPQGDQFYDAEGRVLYSSLAESAEFRRGIEQVEQLASQKRTALLCSEENPAICHRHLLIGRVLCGRSNQVIHIRGDGQLQSYQEVVKQAADEKDHGQRTLFDVEDDAWKSIRSVLPKNPPPSSLES
ncbi:MAG: DUF488 domain-containing protein [Pirellulales bacterium]|nr:DUF488 domain-containing protein [Pirellulales bacterium]